MWVNHVSSQLRRDILLIPPELDTPTPNHSKIAEVITSYWNVGSFPDYLRPFLQRLLEIGEPFQATEEEFID